MDVSFASCPGRHKWQPWFVVSGVTHRECAKCGRVEHLIPVDSSGGVFAPGFKEAANA